MHPKLGVICDTSREVFPNTPITIITNGLLIRNTTSDIWDKCIENNIIVRVTRYPISFDYENAIKMLREIGVKIEESSIVSDFIKMPLDIDGKDYYENFKNCFTGTECILLSHGKLYPCAYPANVKWLNRVSINSFLLSKYDGVNIYEHNELDEIMEEIAKPMPFCKYCAYSKGELSEEWKQYDGTLKCWSV